MGLRVTRTALKSTGPAGLSCRRDHRRIVSASLHDRLAQRQIAARPTYRSNERETRGFQVVRDGGATEAAKDFDSLVSASGAQVRTYYGPVKSATLADGTEAVLRTSTTKGYAGSPTLELQHKVGNLAVKIRYQ